MYYEGSKMQERDEDRRRYSENPNQIPVPNVKGSPTILEGICASLFNELNSQENSIQRIQSKLHAIANRSEPQTKSDNLTSADKPNYDMEQQLNIQVKRIAYHNNLLEKIEKHLNEII